jgi:hypothetical protein
LGTTGRWRARAGPRARSAGRSARRSSSTITPSTQRYERAVFFCYFVKSSAIRCCPSCELIPDVRRKKKSAERARSRVASITKAPPDPVHSFLRTNTIHRSARRLASRCCCTTGSFSTPGARPRTAPTTPTSAACNRGRRSRGRWRPWRSPTPQRRRRRRPPRRGTCREGLFFFSLVETFGMAATAPRYCMRTYLQQGEGARS